MNNEPRDEDLSNISEEKSDVHNISSLSKSHSHSLN